MDWISCTETDIVDFILSNRNNSATGQQSKFSEWLNNTFHEGKHATNAPIDYQGKGFGGGYHRELSKGHDIARFAEGIKMFKDGSFEGVRYIDGVAHTVVMTAKCEIAEDYSNIEALKQFIKPGSKEKLHEMLLVAHAIVTAVNVGKVVITRNFAEINITEIMSVVRYGVSVVSAMNKRNGEYAKLIYHAERTSGAWEQLDQAFLEEERRIIGTAAEPLVIG